MKVQYDKNTYPNHINSSCKLDATLKETSIALNGLLLNKDVYQIKNNYEISRSTFSNETEPNIQSYLSTVQQLSLKLTEQDNKTLLEYYITYRHFNKKMAFFFVALFIVIITALLLNVGTDNTTAFVFLIAAIIISALVITIVVVKNTAKEYNYKFYDSFLKRLEVYIKIVQKNEEKIKNKADDRFDYSNRFN